MAESTAVAECSNPAMDTSPSDPTHQGNHPGSSHAARPSSPMEDVEHNDQPAPAAATSYGPPQPRTTPLKGSKSSSMLRSVTAPHPLSMSTSNNSLHHFQTSANAMYTTAPSSTGFTTGNGADSMFPAGASFGPLSAPSSPTFPSSSNASGQAPSSFMAMNGHNSSLYEPFRRNSVPILTVDQAEHKRKASEEKQMHRQGSWSSFSSNSTMGGPMSVVGAPPPVLHHLDAAHLDPATMHYYRTQFSQQHVLQQQQQQQQQQQLHLQHGLHQVMPPSNSATGVSPMNDTYMSSHSMNSNHANASSGMTGAIRGSSKVKRNNSICSTTSISSTGSGSNNKHPCKFPSCEWSFKRYEHLKRHMLVHTKERPFQCDFTGCNKSFSRSDNFSAHLRTHSKKAMAHRRYDSRGMETGNGNSTGEGSIKQESQDPQLMSSSSGGHDPQQGGMAGFIPHSSLHMSNSYSSGSMSQEASEYGRDYSPPRSPGGNSMSRSSSALENHSSSMNDDDSFDMMGHTSYAFGSSSMYSLDHLDHLNSMVPRFDTIRLDIKSVAPGEIHKSYEDDSHSDAIINSSNPNGESPRASPMPQYEHFSFPSSISTHFMPMLPGGSQGDHSSSLPTPGQHSQHPSLNGPMSHESMSSGSYSSLPSADSFSSSPSFNHHGYSSDGELRGIQFSHPTVNGGGGGGGDSDLHYSPSPPLNEDGSQLHHPQPYHHGHHDLYESKAANPQLLHHSYPPLPPSATSSALPPHPLMSSLSNSPAPGLNEPLYSSSSSGSRGQHAKNHQRQMTKLQQKQQRNQPQMA